jgi:hypothetical protein
MRACCNLDEVCPINNMKLKFGLANVHKIQNFPKRLIKNKDWLFTMIDLCGGV